MKVCISGGAGYIGSVLVGQLVAERHEVTVLDSLLYGNGESLLPYWGDIRFVRGDIRNQGAVADALDGVDTIVHLAALVGEAVCERDPERTWSINTMGTQGLLSAAKAKGVKLFIFASTCSNYGKQSNDEPVTEDCELQPLSAYARTKIAAERLVMDANGASGMATVVFRFGTAFGLSPRMRFDLLVNELVRDAVCKGRIEVYGRDAWRPFASVECIAGLLCEIIDSWESNSWAGKSTSIKTELAGQVFNLAPTNLLKGELAEFIARKVPGLEVGYIPADAKTDPRDYRVSQEKLRRIGLAGQDTLEKHVSETVAALRAGIFPDPYSTRYRNA